jgi:hypothetical protein
MTEETSTYERESQSIAADPKTKVAARQVDADRLQQADNRRAERHLRDLEKNWSAYAD